MGRLHLTFRVFALVALFVVAEAGRGANFAPIGGLVSIRAGDKDPKSAAAALGSVSLTDNTFPDGINVASASLQTSLSGGSRFDYAGSVSTLTDTDPGGNPPRATASISFTQSFTTITQQWIELSANVRDDPVDAGTAGVISLARSGQPALFSVGHTAGFTAYRAGLFAPGTFTLSGFLSSQAINLNPPNHDASAAGQLLVAELADFDASGSVTSSDLLFWRRGFGEANPTFARGNLDGDADVDGGDFLLWQRQLGTAALATSASATIPEPSAIVLTAAVVAMLGRAKWRRR